MLVSAYQLEWNQGWILSFLASGLCVLGCLIIYIDDLYRLLLPSAITKRFPFELNQNYGFLIGSLGFSAGCLLFTSLYRLLPHATEYLAESPMAGHHVMEYVMGAYLMGVFICLGLNGVLHLLTSESVVHCSHGHGNEHEHGNDTNEFGSNDLDPNGSYIPGIDPSELPDSPDLEADPSHDNSHSLKSARSFTSYGSIEPVLKTTKSFPQDSDKRVKKQFSLLHIFGKEATGDCKGYSSAEVCINEDNKKLHYCELPTLNRTHEIHSVTSHDGNSQSQSHHNNHEHFDHSHHDQSHHGHGHGDDAKSIHSDHHHHVATPLSRLLMIGIQTTLAITLHKLPEGFVTYITSEADSKLGIEIFLSLLVHNFIEGFLMCLPLYYLFSQGKHRQYNKFKAVIISGGLGGIAQPLGAGLGYLFLQFNPILSDNGQQLDTLNFVFGNTIAMTAGFLTVVSLSMFGSAISFNNRSVNVVIVWAVLGIAVIGGSLILTDAE